MPEGLQDNGSFGLTQHLNPELLVVYLTGGTCETHRISEEIVLPDTREKRFALVFRFKDRFGSQFERKAFLNLTVTGLFKCFHNSHQKTYSDNLMISKASHIQLGHQSHDGTYCLTIDNRMMVPVKLGSITVAGTLY